VTLTKMVDFEEFATLKFLLINSRWFGGAGFRTLEPRMEEAVRNLPISSELLADLLITILEIQDRDEAKKSRCTNLSRYSRPRVL
jgi:hypothetical protein